MGGIIKILSWNVNGIRSALQKEGLPPLISSKEYDILMFQEVKADQLPLELHGNGYTPLLYPAKKKGYSGLLTLTKKTPLEVTYGIGDAAIDDEARVLTAEFDRLFVVNTYFPNSRRELERLDFKLGYNDKFAAFAQKLRKRKPVLLCGDFNVAHEEIDIARPRENIGNAGFTNQEREWIGKFLGMGYVDTFRMFTKEGGHYSWWAFRSNVRERNIGWRIDYAIVTDDIKERVKSSGILGSVHGSDHAPITVELDMQL